MGRKELRMLSVTLGLAVLLYAAFVAVGSFRGDGAAGPEDDAAPPRDYEEYLVLQVAAEGDGWVVSVAGRAFREAEPLRAWIEANEAGTAGMMFAPRSMAGRVVPIAQACLDGGLTKVETRFVDDPPAAEDGE
jgi:hypothetical protein